MAIVIISGACGTGKSSIAHLLAETSENACAVHVHTDDFYQYICKGYIEPWLEKSANQNKIVMDAIVACAKSFSNNGYEVYIDGVIGPWFLKPWLELAKEGIDVRYIILRPSQETTISRALNREKNKTCPLSRDVIKNMWTSFSCLDKYEVNAVDTSAQTLVKSVEYIKKMLQENAFRLSL